jgi:septal ring factor EnvC (AmiA/AmiB activator)
LHLIDQAISAVMDDLSNLVKGLDIKSRQLALRYKTLKDDFIKLEQKFRETENSNTEYKKSILELEKQIQILTIAKSIPTGKESSKAKKKINELLRELDTCIDLLNNKTI